MDKKKGGLREIIYAEPTDNATLSAAEESTDDTGDVRINIRVSKATMAWLKHEANESATTVSGLCSLAIYDWVKARKQNDIVISREDIMRSLRDPDVDPETKEQLKKLLK